MVLYADWLTALHARKKRWHAFHDALGFVVKHGVRPFHDLHIAHFPIFFDDELDNDPAFDAFAARLLGILQVRHHEVGDGLLGSRSDVFRCNFSTGWTALPSGQRFDDVHEDSFPRFNGLLRIGNQRTRQTQNEQGEHFERLNWYACDRMEGHGA